MEKLNLSQLRQEINTIDEKIINLIAIRRAIAKKIGIYKLLNKIDITDHKREKELLSRYNLLSIKYNIPGILLQQVFKLIIKDAKQLQKENHDK